MKSMILFPLENGGGLGSPENVFFLVLGPSSQVIL